MTRARTQEVPGYRVQPKLPISVVCFGGRCDKAEFTTYGDIGACVEAEVRLGLIKAPYMLVLTYEQALDADIIEKV